MTHDTNLPAIAPPRPARIEVMAPTALMDTAKFEHMQRIAGLMARATMIPDHLHSVAKGTGASRILTPLPFETVMANCFMVVNQADRWQMDPFAVAQCVAIVHGRLCYEGKLIHAVVEARAGIRLQYSWNEEQGDRLAVTVSGQYDDEDFMRTVTGSVAEWKTSQWGAGHNDRKKRLAYRGAREWARLHAPGVMLGIYSDDEMEDLRNDVASRRAVPISQRLAQQSIGTEAGPVSTLQAGFNRADLQEQLGAGEVADPETGEVTQETANEVEASAPEAETATESATQDADPRDAYSVDEKRVYAEGRKAHENNFGPHMPKAYRHDTMKHLQVAYTQGYLDAVSEGAA